MKAAEMKMRRWRAGKADRCWRSMLFLLDTRGHVKEPKAIKKNWGEMLKMSK